MDDPSFHKFQHTLWRQRLEVDVASKEAELQALKDARNDDRRLLGINFINILRAHFLDKSAFCQNVTREKLR
jgi:hypothetical protein